MSPVLLELMEPEFEEAKKVSRKEGWEEGHAKGRLEGIDGAVKILRSLKLSPSEIKQAIMDQYSLSETEIDKLL